MNKCLSEDLNMMPKKSEHLEIFLNSMCSIQCKFWQKKDDCDSLRKISNLRSTP
jgi:hypothetical protein